MPYKKDLFNVFQTKEECPLFYKIKENPGFFTIYDDGLFSIKHFVKNGISKHSVLKIKQGFINQLIAIYHEAFLGNIEFKKVNMDEFISKARKKLKGKKTISLDQLYKGDYNISLARVYNIADIQKTHLHYSTRPEDLNQTLFKQISDIPAGKYTIVDDDQATGGTIRFLKSLLPIDVEIEDNCLYMDSDLGYKSFTAMYAKDFMFGALGGGLVVKLPNNELARVPYIFPYVNLCVRAVVPPENEFKFSLNVLKLNKSFFEQLGNNLKLKDMDLGFVIAMKFLGFDENDEIVNIINWHIEEFEQRYELLDKKRPC